MICNNSQTNNLQNSKSQNIDLQKPIKNNYNTRYSSTYKTENTINKKYDKNNTIDNVNKVDKVNKESKIIKKKHNKNSNNNNKKRKFNNIVSKCKNNLNKFCQTTCKKISNLNCSHIFYDSNDKSLENNNLNHNVINNNLNNNNLNNNNSLDANIYDNKNVNCFNKKKKRKQKIPLAVKQNVWVTNFGEVYKHKCYVDWCHRVMTVFEFEVGHNIPESKGGTLDLNNLRPICHQCNIGMGNQYTIDEWSDQKFLDK